MVDYFNPTSKNFLFKDLYLWIYNNIGVYLIPGTDKFFLNGVLDFFNNLFTYFTPGHENFILKDVINFFKNLISWINPFSDNFIGKHIANLFGELFRWLFVPGDTYFSDKIDGIKSGLSEKLPYQDYIDMFETVKTVSAGEDLSVSISGYNVGGNSFTMPKFIDFSWVTDYKETWYAWVRGIVFVLLIIYNLNQIMKLLRGFSLADGTSHINTANTADGGGKK